MASSLWRFICDRAPVTGSPANRSEPVASILLTLSSALASESSAAQAVPPLVQQLHSLLDLLLASPKAIVEMEAPLVPMGLKLLAFYGEQTGQVPTTAQTVALMSQAVYVDVLRSFLSQAKFQKWIAAVGDRPPSAAVQQQLQALDSFELGDIDARLAVPYFQNSSLAAAYGDILAARLVDWGVKLESARQVTTRLAQQTSRLMLPVLMKQSPAVKALLDWYRRHGSVVFEKYLGIDAYLEADIARGPQALVFGEGFTLADIYIPPKAQPLNAKGETDASQGPMFLADWAQWLLTDPAQASQVMVLRGEPGRGKSSFCRIFADWVRHHERANWIPVIINLADVTPASQPVEEILNGVMGEVSGQSGVDWLTDYNLNFLFLLDGLDQLQSQTPEGLRQFMAQVGQFQQRCAQEATLGHRILLTGTPSSLQTLQPDLPENLQQVRLLPMDNSARSQWLDRWQNLLGPNQRDFGAVLTDKRLPEWLQGLTREPLMAYVLAAMGRDGYFKLEQLAWVEGAKAKMFFYERMIAWGLANRGDDRAAPPLRASDFSREATSSLSRNIRRALQGAATTLMQSGRGVTRLDLTQGSGLEPGTVSEQAREIGLESLWHALARFYLQPGGEDALQPVRQSFIELLCAEHLIDRLMEGCRPGADRDYAVDDAQFCWTVYDLLGVLSLTPGTLEYLMFMLSKCAEPETAQLHRRLQDFYCRWNQGEFIDADADTLPQQKKRRLQAISPQLTAGPGQRQVDMAVGLNTLILLLHLHRYGQYLLEAQAAAGERPQNVLAFHPCYQRRQIGQSRDRKQLDASQLMRIIGMSQCLGPTAFVQKVGPFLGGAILSGADLRSANLAGVDLAKADLTRATLSHGNLQGANLRSATLYRSNLSDADLSGADLQSSQLSNADLSRANLSNACLSQANLKKACLRNANLEKAILINTVLARANLMGANLSQAKLSGANLSQADLSHAALRSIALANAIVAGVSFISADLRSADLSGATLNGTDFRSANLSSADLKNADLSGANLSGTNLSNTDLDGAVLLGVNLFEAKLFEASLKAANLDGANLFHVNLGSADLSEASLRGADLSHSDLFEAKLSGTNLSAADLFEANLTGANLSGANLSDGDLRGTMLLDADLRGADLSGADFFNANLSGANLSGANLSGANLSGVDLSNADLTGAILSQDSGIVQWDAQTNWHEVEGLDRAIGLPEKLMRQIGVFAPDAPHPDLIFAP